MRWNVALSLTLGMTFVSPILRTLVAHICFNYNKGFVNARQQDSASSLARPTLLCSTLGPTIPGQLEYLVV